MTAGLLLLTLAAPPAATGLPGATGLQAGDELLFGGTVAEAVDRPDDRFRRNHSLEVRVLVLAARDSSADVAVLTRLKRSDDAVTGAVGVITGTEADRNTPPVIHLDLVRVHADGTVYLLTPAGPPPYRLGADTPARTVPPPPLDSFNPHEFGVFPPPPPRDNRGEPWTVASSGGRPPETWQVRETGFVHAERCRLLLMNQKSDDWDRPVGGQTAWHRSEAVWVSTQDGTARRVHRLIRQRVGRSESATARVETRYELTGQARLTGRTLERTRRDVEIAYAALSEATRLASEAPRLGPRVLEARLARLDAQLAEMHPSSPYREVLLAARRVIDAARRGEVALFQPVAGLLPDEAVSRPRWPEAGDPAPDFAAGSFRLSDYRGRPVLLVFFRPSGETTDHALRIAQAAARRYAGRLVVATFAVFADPAAGVRDRDRLKLDIPVYDGSAAVTPYAIATAPRFALIDAAGTVAWEFVGVGGETGSLLKDQADRLVPVTCLIAPTGITPARELVLPPIVPHP